MAKSNIELIEENIREYLKAVKKLDNDKKIIAAERLNEKIEECIFNERKEKLIKEYYEDKRLILEKYKDILVCDYRVYSHNNISELFIYHRIKFDDKIFCELPELEEGKYSVMDPDASFKIKYLYSIRYGFELVDLETIIKRIIEIYEETNRSNGDCTD